MILGVSASTETKLPWCYLLFVFHRQDKMWEYYIKFCFINIYFILVYPPTRERKNKNLQQNLMVI